jgi:hypothetical protein
VPAQLLTLPHPAAPDVDYFLLAHGHVQVLPAVTDRALRTLAIEPEQAARLERLTQESAGLWQLDEKQLRVALVEFKGRVRAVLGPERFRDYERVLALYVEERLLTPRRNAAFREPETGIPYASWPLL